jgi:hypothetical protein
VPAKIKHARVAAAHEGIAEMIVAIEYDNGGVTEIYLDRHSAETLLSNTESSSLDDLVGASWEQVRDALSTSFNRF